MLSWFCVLFPGGRRRHQSAAGKLVDHFHEGSGDVRRWEHSATVQQHEAGGGADGAGQKSRRHVRPVFQRMVRLHCSLIILIIIL